MSHQHVRCGTCWAGVCSSLELQSEATYVKLYSVESLIKNNILTYVWFITVIFTLIPLSRSACERITHVRVLTDEDCLGLWMIWTKTELQEISEKYIQWMLNGGWNHSVIMISNKILFFLLPGDHKCDQLGVFNIWCFIFFQSFFFFFSITRNCIKNYQSNITNEKIGKRSSSHF